MTVLIWWRDRLNVGEPLHDQATRTQGADVRFRQGQGPNGWPNAVSKQRLYDDYLWWFDASYLKPFRDVPFYVDNPTKLPSACDRLAFFSLMQPLIVPTGLAARTYPVKVNVQHEGRLIPVKRSRSFYRLALLEDHRVAFVLHSGMRLTDATPHYDAAEIALLKHPG